MPPITIDSKSIIIYSRQHKRLLALAATCLATSVIIYWIGILAIVRLVLIAIAILSIILAGIAAFCAFRTKIKKSRIGFSILSAAAVATCLISWLFMPVAKIEPHPFENVANSPKRVPPAVPGLNEPQNFHEPTSIASEARGILKKERANPPPDSTLPKTLSSDSKLGPLISTRKIPVTDGLFLTISFVVVDPIMPEIANLENGLAGIVLIENHLPTQNFNLSRKTEIVLFEDKISFPLESPDEKTLSDRMKALDYSTFSAARLHRFLRIDKPLIVDIDGKSYTLSEFWVQHIRDLVNAIEDARSQRVRLGLSRVLGLKFNPSNSFRIDDMKKLKLNDEDATPRVYQNHPEIKHYAFNSMGRDIVLEFENQRLRVMQFLLKDDPNLEDIKDIISELTAAMGPPVSISENNRSSLLMASWSTDRNNCNIYVKRTPGLAGRRSRIVMTGVISLN